MCSADERAHLGHRLDDVARPRLGQRAVRRPRPARAAARRRAAAPARPTRGSRARSLLRDAAGDAAALQRADLDAVLGGHASHERRRLGAEPILERVAAVRRAAARLAARRGGCWAAARRPQIRCGGGRRRSGRRRRPAPARPALAPRRRDGRVHVRLEARDDRLHRHRLPFGHEDLGEHAARRRRNLGVDLVRRDLEDRLVALHLVADLLQPLRQRAFGDRFAHLGHHDVYTCHRITLVPSCCARRRATRSSQIATAGSSTAPAIAPKTAYVNQLHGAPVSASDGALRQPRRRSSRSAPRSFRRRQTRRTP